MSIEVIFNFRDGSDESDAFYDAIEARYFQVQFTSNGAQASCQYLDPKDQRVVFENHWNTATGYDRWILKDPAGELWFLANMPAQGEIRRKP